MPPILADGALAPRAGPVVAPLEPLGATSADRGAGRVPAGACRSRAGTANQATAIRATAGITTRRPRMHANTLRKYEREQLLSPARTDGNLRLYSNEDMARLQQIKTLSEERGVNVAGIRLALGVAEEVRKLRRDVADDQAIGTTLPEQQ